MLQIAFLVISYMVIKKKLKDKLKVGDDEEEVLKRVVLPSGRELSKTASKLHTSFVKYGYQGIPQRSCPCETQRGLFHPRKYRIGQSKNATQQPQMFGADTLRYLQNRPSKGLEDSFNSRVITTILEENEDTYVSDNLNHGQRLSSHANLVRKTFGRNK